MRAGARLMTLAENSADAMVHLLALSAAWPEPRMVAGVTGPPGSGKSALVDRLIAGFRKRHPDRRIGVVAVDPSSPFTGGALLGDRIRMMRHAADPMVFVRSAATRGRLGGLMLGAICMVRIMGLIGSDIVLIETAGTGQDEVDVAKAADLVALVFSPGHGDSIQLLKAGLIEIGDIIVVNKADQPGAAQLYAQLQGALSLRTSAGSGHPVELCLISALKDQGVGELIGRLESRYDHDHAHWQVRRRVAIEDEIKRVIIEELSRRSAQAISCEDVQRVLRGELSIASAVNEVSRKLACRETRRMTGERNHD
jgi:LAO/AO transport system kinase